ncbi:MAG: hypothetical protein IPO17_17510 [Flavobacteriales bacterium]|nr:hypothetical protein [Flavobacteriales bacterium]
MRTTRPFLLASLGFLLCAPPMLRAQSGELDLTFNTTGYNVVQGGFQDVYQDMTVQADGKIVAVGTRLDPGFLTSALRIARYNTDGTPDNSFGTNGIVDYVLGTAHFGYAVEVLADGKILVAGGVNDGVGSLQWLLLRLNADGSSDISFALGGSQLVDYIDGNEDLAYEMAVQPDGKILLAGVVVDSLQRYTPAIYRFTDNGFLDMSFGVGGLAIVPVVEAENEFSNIKVRPDGKIVATGHYSNVFNDWGVLVAQFDTNGVLDPAFGTGGYTVEPIGYIQAEAYGLALTSAGDIIVAGTTKDLNITFDMFVGRFTGAGVLDASFGTNGFTLYDATDENIAYDCLLDADGKILVGGTTGGTFFDNRDLTVWRYNADGTSDLSFNLDGVATAEVLGFMDEINGIALQADGKLVVAGKANNGNENDFVVARFLTTGSTGLIGSPATSALLAPNPVAAGSTLHVELPIGAGMVRMFELVDVAGRLVADLPLMSSAFLDIPATVVPGKYVLRPVGNVLLKPLSLVITR